MSDSKSTQVSKTLLSIQADLDNAVISMVATSHLFSSIPVSLPINWVLIQVHQTQLVTPSPSCVIFWPSTRPKNTIPRWYTGRKWLIPMASNRKRLRGRIKAYDMGQGEGPIVPLQTSELHDSYFCLMTIKHPISKIQWVIVWALNYYLTQLSSGCQSSCQQTSRQ